MSGFIQPGPPVLSLPPIQERYLCFSQFANIEKIVTPHQILKPTSDRVWPVEPALLLEPNLDGYPSAKLKKHVRKFVPCEFRRKMWLMLSGAEQIMKRCPTFYDEQQHKIQHIGSVPTFGSSYDTSIFPLNEEGQHCRNKILRVIALTNPHITCCPLMPVMVSILLCFMNEGETFFVIIGLIESEKLEHSQPGVIAERNTLGDIVYNRARSAWKAMYQIAYSYDPQASLDSLYPVFEKWEAWIFHCLFFWAQVRILDCYFVEGPKVFYRIGCAIVILFHKYILKKAKKDEIKHLQEELVNFSSHLPVSDNELLDTAFNIPNLSRNLIQKLYKRHVLLNLTRIGGSTEVEFIIPTPKPDIPSKILTSEEQWYSLWQWIPERFQIYSPQKIYEAETHGYNIVSMYNRLDEIEPFILLIKTAKGDVFGAYCSSSFYYRIVQSELNFFGTGETFLFTFASKTPKKFPWVGLHQSEGTTDMFMAANDSYMVVGGGDGGFGIYLDHDMEQGSSTTCSTFNNSPLCSSEDGYFTCTAVEVYSFLDTDI